MLTKQYCLVKLLPDKIYPALSGSDMIKFFMGMLTNCISFVQTYNDTSKRLELWFRPHDVGCKPLYGDRQMCNSLVLKVRRRRKRCKQSDEAAVTSSDESSEVEPYEYDVRILGIADTIYTFQSKFVNTLVFLPI
jgi:Tau95 Triple barrel domain